MSIMLGRAKTGPAAQTFVFDGKRYRIGQTYRWSDLPASTRRDARAQADDIQAHYGRGYQDALYRLLLIPNASAEQLLRKRYGEEYDRISRSPEVRRISSAIRRDGVKRPPILEEAIDEAIAMVTLGLDVPYFDVSEALLAPEHFIPSLEGPKAQGRLFSELMKLRQAMATAAQKIYDEWQQDPEGVDEEFGSGGICDRIAEAISDVIASNIGNAELTEAGQGGDDHSWVEVWRGQEAYGVDIPAWIYETGGGYRWKKRPGVVFHAEHISIFPVDLSDSHESC
jgi:hypothetical protein